MKRYAPFCIMAAGCLWGSMGLFVRRLNEMGLASMEIVELRCIIAVVLLFAVTFIINRPLLKVKPSQLPPLAGSGIFSIIFFNYCYFSTITMMDLSMAAILLYTSPIFVMLLSLLIFHERLTAKKLMALALAFAGCCLVCGLTGAAASITLPGLMLGLGSAIGYALYSIFSRFSINNGLRSITITNYTFLFAAAGGLVLTDFSVYKEALAAFGAEFIMLAVIYTVVTTVLPYILYTTGLEYMENGPASVIASIEPVVATVLGFAVFAETPSISTVAGIVLVLAALSILNLGK